MFINKFMSYVVKAQVLYDWFMEPLQVFRKLPGDPWTLRVNLYGSFLARKCIEELAGKFPEKAGKLVFHGSGPSVRCEFCHVWGHNKRKCTSPSIRIDCEQPLNSVVRESMREECGALIALRGNSFNLCGPLPKWTNLLFKKHEDLCKALWTISRHTSFATAATKLESWGLKTIPPRYSLSGIVPSCDICGLLKDDAMFDGHEERLHRKPLPRSTLPDQASATVTQTPQNFLRRVMVPQRVVEFSTAIEGPGHKTLTAHGAIDDGTACSLVSRTIAVSLSLLPQSVDPRIPLKIETNRGKLEVMFEICDSEITRI
jgi:hypothetical protein